MPVAKGTEESAPRNKRKSVCSWDFDSDEDPLAPKVAAANDQVEHYDVGIYAAGTEIEQAWTCGAVITHMESVMSEVLERDIELSLTINESYQAGVMDMTNGNVQFGRFSNVSSKWVLNHRITDEVANAWLAALKRVDPEGVLKPRDLSLDSDCSSDKVALAQ